VRGFFQFPQKIQSAFRGQVISRKFSSWVAPGAIRALSVDDSINHEPAFISDEE
jgi:hypothetical protein